MPGGTVALIKGPTGTRHLRQRQGRARAGLRCRLATAASSQPTHQIIQIGCTKLAREAAGEQGGCWLPARLLASVSGQYVHLQGNTAEMVGTRAHKNSYRHSARPNRRCRVTPQQPLAQQDHWASMVCISRPTAQLLPQSPPCCLSACCNAVSLIPIGVTCLSQLGFASHCAQHAPTLLAIWVLSTRAPM